MNILSSLHNASLFSRDGLNFISCSPTGGPVWVPRPSPRPYARSRISTKQLSARLLKHGVLRLPANEDTCKRRDPKQGGEIEREERGEETMELQMLGMNFGCVLGALRSWEFPAKDCLLPLVSKLLGYCIVAASTTVKLPQILKILKHNSVRGLSVVAFELEVVGYTIALSYCIHKGLPFSAYGELLFLLIQAIILVAIIYYYSQPIGGKTWMKSLLYCALAPTVLSGQIDPFLFEALYASQHAIFFFARVPQIWENYKNKSTGALSFLTCFMNFAGSIVRVFTSIQENAPLSVIMGSVIGIMMNGTILSQIIIYQKPVAKKEKKVQ